MLEPVVRGVAVAHVALVQDHVVQVGLVSGLNDRLKLKITLSILFEFDENSAGILMYDTIEAAHCHHFVASYF